MSDTPATPPRPVRRRGVGPFSLRQVTIAIVAMKSGDWNWNPQPS